ncbi:ankyrin repeat domain-containing protein [Legionella pneumophila]|uniref:ankyrin repeat domain-containing protein n=1 Tax=Legionella pneumophila TaxID=446 RepID=UPI003A4C7EC9
MLEHLIQTNEDIHKYPEIDKRNSLDTGAELTLGDLHGNALKFLYFLIRQRVVTNISEQHYDQFKNIYMKGFHNLTRLDIDRFHVILSKVCVNSHAKVRLIGDELADRGSNDYFTLKIIETLSLQGVDIEILMSNHSIEFLISYEEKRAFNSAIHLSNKYIRSMTNLQNLINEKIIQRKDVERIIKSHYVPNLKIISYSTNTDNSEITIFSHAPIGLEEIKFLAEDFDVNYHRSTVEKLAETINQINSEFNDYLDVKNVHLIHEKNSPFYKILWNRDQSSLRRPTEYHGYKINFVHGHEGMGKSTDKNIANLDSCLGKTVGTDILTFNNVGMYSVLYVNGPRDLAHESYISTTLNAFKQGGKDALFEVIETSSINIDELLFGRGESLLDRAVEQNEFEFACALLDCGARANASSSTRNTQIIHRAASKGNIGFFKKIINENPLLVNQLDKFNQSPILWAASRGHSELVDYLISIGADIDKPFTPNGFKDDMGENVSNYTSLCWAVHKQHKNCALSLIAVGADCTTTLENRESVLTLAKKNPAWDDVVAAIYLKIGNLDEAITHATIALESEPENVLALGIKENVYKMKGNYRASGSNGTANPLKL